jgi:hypothetical protein
MTKTQTNARISTATRSKLDDLTEVYGTQAEVLAVAIDRLWREHYAVAADIPAEQAEED